ncbi:steroid hormone receptor ERR1 [Cloeon dipterum]|uniref:steroid hormone receptor ERR1 n=1 Tax=Cloeon dipterum TaxID=197152 RepID=UPI00321F85DD
MDRMDDGWMENVVNMMSGNTDEGDNLNIKKEEVDHANFQPCSPSNSNVYSPSTTMEICSDSQGTPRSPKCLKFAFVDAGATSPGSPDRQFCSSTTQSIGDPMITRTEESMKEDDSPRRLCLVCGDTASGFHYGVASCEACKAFFKRTIQGNIEYTCPAANDCEINKRRRKACQACRFQKCLRMGMLKEGVRLDRVRGGRQKYRRNPEMPYQMQHVSAPVAKPSLEENKMLEVLGNCEPEILQVGPDHCHSADSEYQTISVLSELYDRELVGIITWAKQIPGFMDLSLNDQMRLLQSTWAEILTLTLVFRSLQMSSSSGGSSGKLKFASDFWLDEKLARESGATEIYQHCIQILSRFSRLSLAREEYLLLKALVLVNSDINVDEFIPLKQLRDTVLTSLTDCVSVLRPNTSAYHVQQLLLSLPALRQADFIIRRFWSDVRHDAKVPMNKLFVEMLEACHR